MDNTNSLIIEGRNAVLEALKSDCPINKIILNETIQSTDKLYEIIKLAKTKGIVLQWVPKKQLNLLTTTFSHQGIIAFASPQRYVEVEEICDKAEKLKEPLFIVLLDRIEDPRNFGSILRTAETTGVHGIIIPKRRSVALTPTVVKTSAGASFYQLVSRVNNLVMTIKSLKKMGVWMVGLDMNGQNFYHKVNMAQPIGLVIGGEGKGLSRLVKEECDFLVRIPMKGKITSLNVSVATAIMMYEVYKQRNYS